MNNSNTNQTNIFRARAYGSITTIVLVTHDTDEALYLSDEVVVFSPNPGTIRNRFTVNAERPRRRSDTELLELKQRITSLFKYDINNESEYSI